MGKRLPPKTVAELKALNWKDYMKTTHWRKFSKSLLDDEDCVCEICGKKRWNGKYVRGKNKGKRKRNGLFNIHHKTYDNIGEEAREDVMVLCKPCHQFLHDSETMSRTRGNLFTEVYEFLKEKTSWDYKKFGT